ncbi:uncharacterized protein BO88DRAFT_36934 [Aspergillus vadensis CBS 113365]|uniref:Uncharacterized protein n=1 Tax=Aspergillus vadensis (strain CBS 113365 / IMI 142717 / IBT 24658) TaxID=1448311 RepID=A0A319C2F3_ASPVC|nr:hypothetical protein BO88DRAFT_36934 [Aspergillus vadensis CBS 113365]PYH69598.1 hypothetical protein BO88DRAFT_36934 [Aspergillus vadensis CBS 113365]
MKTFSSSILACRGDPLCDVVIALSSGSLISAPCERSIQLLKFHRKSTHCASSLFGDYHTTDWICSGRPARPEAGSAWLSPTCLDHV